jgi:hypothetical protein
VISGSDGLKENQLLWEWMVADRGFHQNHRFDRRGGNLVEAFMKRSLTAQMLILARTLVGGSFGQDAIRVKVAHGEYRVPTDEDLGVGPIETEVFHFRRSWTLWRTADRNYEVDGKRMFESPRDTVHQNRFWGQLTRDLRLVKVKEFAKLCWRPDSGPLTCDSLPHKMRFSSGGKDPTKSIEVKLTTKQPYGIIWPISVFSLSGLAYVSAEHEGEVMPVELVTLKELSEALPVLTRFKPVVRSDIWDEMRQSSALTGRTGIPECS